MNAMTLPVNRTYRQFTSMARTASPQDRRTFQRYDGEGLVALVYGQQVEIDDFSLGGLRLHIDLVHLPQGAEIEFTLVPRMGAALQTERAVRVCAVIQGHADYGSRVAFRTVTFSLAKILIQQMARKNGLKPYIFK